LVVDVVAVVGFFDAVVAGFEAELVASDEKRPVVYLRVGAVVRGSRQVVREYEATEWIAEQICTMRIKFSAGIAGLEIDIDLFQVTSDLDISRRFDELDGGESTRGDNAGTVTGLRAPCYDLSFDVSDDTVRGGRTPETKVCNVVEEHRLA